ncbi:MAG: hypothetical protein J6M95_02615 [Bacilli bacterium]|nr:hypothetical protein [Bacilli bacterium]
MRLNKLHKYSAAITFLAMEIFAVLAFSFSGNFIVYGAISLALAILLILFNIAEMKIDGISSIAFFFLPLFLFSTITALSVYSRSHAYVGDFSTVELVFIPIAFIAMSFTGYLLSVDKSFKMSTLLIVIYSALGVLCLINLIVNFVNFGAFYTVLYKGYHMYYGGVMSETTVDKMAYVLEGLKFIEVRMPRYVLFPALLFTSSIALLFVSPKENKRTFIIYSIFVLVSLLSLIFVPSLLGLFSVVLILLIDAIIFIYQRFEKIRKAIRIVILTGLILAGLLFLFIILNNQSAIPFVHNLTSGNSFLNRLFNTNGIINKYNPLVENIFSKEKFLGYIVDNMINQNEVHMSGSFLFDFFMTSGVIGVIAFIFALVVGFKGFKNYFSKENDNLYIKVTLLTFVIFYLAYIGTFNDTEYAIYYKLYQPVYMSAPFLIMIFIFSYILAKGNVAKSEGGKEDEK